MRRWQDRPERAAWALVLAFIGLQVLIKLMLPEGLDLDGAEQVYFAQELRMGYGTRQPPLYTWLYWLLQHGPLPAQPLLEALRFGVILGWFAALGWVLRLCGAAPALQALTLVAHMGLGFVAWRVFDSLTHTTLAVLLVTLGSGALLRWLDTARIGWALAAGLLAGLACLAKFNAGLWWGSAVAAAWLLPAVRRRVPPWQWALYLGTGAAVLAPYALWWLDQRLGAAGLASQIVVPAVGRPWWVPLRNLLGGIGEYLAVGAWALLLAAAWVRRGSRPARPGPSAGLEPTRHWAWQWLAWQAALALLATAVLLVAAQASSFKGRWLWPVAPLLPWVLLWWALGPLASTPLPAAVRRTALAVAGIAFLAVGLRFFEPAVRAADCRNCWSLRPGPDIAVALSRHYGAGVLYLTTDKHLSGLLAAHGLPSHALDTLRTPPPGRLFQRCVAVWVNNGTGPQLDQLPRPPLADMLPSPAHGLERNWPLPYAPQRQVRLRAAEVACPQSVALEPGLLPRLP